MPNTMIEYVVRGIALEKESQMPLALLKEKYGDRVLPLWIGPFEASSIIVEVEGIQPPRLLTHDLLALLFQKHKFRLLGLEIYGHADDAYLSRIRYRRWLRTYTVDVRPSDGLALALRLDAPIYCDTEALSAQGGEEILEENLEVFSSEILFLESNCR